MTCTSCELHIESEVRKLPGVSFVKASYDKGSTTVEFDEGKIETDQIIAAINGTGYKVHQEQNPIELQEKEEIAARTERVKILTKSLESTVITP